MSDDRKEEIEYCSGDFHKYWTCEIDERNDKNYSETCVFFHPCSSFMPSYFDQSISIQRCYRDKVKDGECYIQKTKIDPKTDHQINIIREDIIRSSSHNFDVNEHDEDTDNC